MMGIRSAVAALALAALIALAGCAPGGGDAPDAAGGRREGAEPASGSAASVSGSDPRREAPEAGVAGDADWLADDERDGLEAALAGYFGEGRDLRVVGEPEEVGQAVVTYIEDAGSGSFYEARLYPGDRWAVGPLTRLVEGVNAPSPDAPEEGLDAVSALTSREATFDAANCVPASDGAALSGLLGPRCAEALPGSIADMLEGRGVPGVTALDIMVGREVERAGGVLAFKALAVSGNERIVIACEWDEAAGSLAAEALG